MILWYSYYMKLEDLSYEQAETVIKSLQTLLGEVYEDDSIPYNVEVEDQDPESYDKKEDAHLS